MKRTVLTFGLLAGLLFAGGAQATLIDRGGGLIFDDVLNITWVQNANLANQAFTWPEAVSWADNLVYGGYSDWRLPYISVAAGVGPLPNPPAPVNCNTDGEVACRDNELGYMFYYNLNGVHDENKTGNQVGNGGVVLNNIQSSDYWSGTGQDSIFAWIFDFRVGGLASDIKNNDHGAVWAVRDGNVPEPATGLLLGVGLLGLAVARRWWGR